MLEILQDPLELCFLEVTALAGTLMLMCLLLLHDQLMSNFLLPVFHQLQLGQHPLYYRSDVLEISKFEPILVLIFFRICFPTTFTKMAALDPPLVPFLSHYIQIKLLEII